MDQLAKAAERYLIAHDRQLAPSLSSSRASLKAIEDGMSKEGDSKRVQCYICKEEGHKSSVQEQREKEMLLVPGIWACGQRVYIVQGSEAE